MHIVIFTELEKNSKELESTEDFDGLRNPFYEEGGTFIINKVLWNSSITHTHTHTHSHTETHTHTHIPTHKQTHIHKPSIICLSLGCLCRNSRNNSDIGIASRTSTLRCATISPKHFKIWNKYFGSKK